MVGTFADVVVADAIIKHVPGFDLLTAVAALRKDAFEEPPGMAGASYLASSISVHDVLR